MNTAKSVITAVSCKLDPAYQFAVVRNYVIDKTGRGKSLEYVASKLDVLETKAPKQAKEAFIEVRKFFNMRPSLVFGGSFPKADFNQFNPEITRFALPPQPTPPAVPAPPSNPPPNPPPYGPPSISITPSSPEMGRLGRMMSMHLSAPPRPAGGDTGSSRGGSPAPILEAGENQLEMLKEYDTVFLVDDSSSMRGQRWEEAREAIMGVVRYAVKYDRDGVDVLFLNSTQGGQGLTSASAVRRLFDSVLPNGATPTGRRLEIILRGYMAALERDPDGTKPLNLIVITDGAPTDDPETVLINYARRLDRGDYPLSQVGIQMLQIGSDPQATAALAELDDELAGAHGIRDMVDTVPYQGEMTAELIVKALLGGINRRLDRRGM